MPNRRPPLAWNCALNFCPRTVNESVAAALDQGGEQPPLERFQRGPPESRAAAIAQDHQGTEQGRRYQDQGRDDPQENGHVR